MKGFQYCPLFKNMPEESLTDYLTQIGSYRKRYKKGDTIFRAGQAPVNLFVLLTGAVQIEKLDSNGRKHIVNRFREPGTVFGEVYLFMDDHMYDYDCSVHQDAEILIMPREGCFNFESYHGNAADSIKCTLIVNMLNILADKAYYLNQKLMIHASFSLRQKIATYLMQQSQGQRYFSLKLNREELADYLGSSRPSLSRELMNMQKEGYLEIFKEDVKIDVEKLNQLL